MNLKNKVGIIEYGAGNLASICNAIDFLNFDELDAAYKGAQENNTSLKIDDKNIAISKNEMRATKSTYLPTIGLKM